MELEEGDSSEEREILGFPVNRMEMKVKLEMELKLEVK
jgi:hypothetical protein